MSTAIADMARWWWRELSGPAGRLAGALAAGAAPQLAVGGQERLREVERQGLGGAGGGRQVPLRGEENEQGPEVTTRR